MAHICNPIAKEKCTIDTILRCPHLNMLSINPNTKQITFSFDTYGDVLDIFFILNSKIYIYSGETGDKKQTISFRFPQNAHMTGILYIDYNKYINIFAFGKMSGVAKILNSAGAVIPSLNSNDNTVSVDLIAWGSCKLITMDRNVKVIGSL